MGPGKGVMHLLKLLWYRHKNLWRQIRRFGISNGWWMWRLECNILFDISGEWFEQTISQLKINVTHARWKDNDELADGLQEFIADMQKFQKECHPHLSCTND